jgi:hypothetical protein
VRLTGVELEGVKSVGPKAMLYFTVESGRESVTARCDGDQPLGRSTEKGRLVAFGERADQSCPLFYSRHCPAYSFGESCTSGVSPMVWRATADTAGTVYERGLLGGEGQVSTFCAAGSGANGGALCSWANVLNASSIHTPVTIHIASTNQAAKVRAMALKVRFEWVNY